MYHGILTKCCLYGHSSVCLPKCVICRVLTLIGWFSHLRVLTLIGWFSHSRVLTLIGWFSHSRVLTLIGWFSYSRVLTLIGWFSDRCHSIVHVTVMCTLPLPVRFSLPVVFKCDQFTILVSLLHILVQYLHSK